MRKLLFCAAAAGVLLCGSLQAQTRPAPASPIASRPSPLPATVIIPASAFLPFMPKNDIIADATALKADWIFNNTAITLNNKANLFTQVQVPEAGVYNLYVRSVGAERTSFAVAVNDKVTGPEFGTGALAWKKAGTFDLPKGRANIKITRILESPSFDVVVLSKNPNLTAEDVRPYQLVPEVKLLHEYRIPQSNAVKFGDVNGDGKTDLFVLEPDFSAHVFDNSGKELWAYQAPKEYVRERSEFEAPGVVWDFDHDGRAEVVHWRFIDGQEWLVMADGRTGEIKRKIPYPTKPLPHVYNNFRLAIGKLRPGEPNQLVAFTDFGGGMNIQAYDAELKSLWSYDVTRAKDNLGHYVYPVDLDRDGIDEVLVGSMLLDENGKKVWDRFDLLPDNRDHADSYKFADVNHDGKLDIVTSNSETGVFVYDAATGKVMWENIAEHSQQLAVGDFLKGVPGPQVVIGGRTYGKTGEPGLSSQLFWFDNAGNRVSTWPDNPINGNPDFVRGNWSGDGKVDLFWFKFHINDRGEGDLYFPDPVFHMFDFEGKGAEEVITMAHGVLRVYGKADAHYSGRDMKKNLDYLKASVVNHTHY